MARSKYTPETVERIVEAIEQEGGDRSGWLAGGISEATFYQWLQQYPKFSEQVAQTKQYYRANCDQELKKLAKKSILDYLEGRALETWETEEINYDADGNIIGRKVSKKKVTRPTPKWVIERILGQDMHELDALKVLIEGGWLSPDLVDHFSDRLNSLGDRIKNMLSARFN